MKRFPIISFSIMLIVTAICADAQVVHSATGRGMSITVGGMGSIFQPDYANNWKCTQSTPNSSLYCVPVAGASDYPLFGLGTYVDVKFSHWVQIEAEARWLRFNKYSGISQNNYLIGPRVPIHRFGKAQIYGKALVGDAKMTFDKAGTSGSYTALAFGGGTDIKLDKHWSLRFPDIEYQYYPKWNNSSLSPYGASVGVGYTLF
jgi:hypothetical protein